MRTSIRTLASAAALATASLAIGQTSVVNQTTVLINGMATPVANGPLGSFVGNVGNNTGTPPPNNGTVGQLPASEFPNTPIITPALAATAIDGITVPAEFEAKVFATPPIVNYPTTVAAAPDGTLYVGVDGNGAQSAWDHMGRIIRLKDTNHDGVADEATAFVPDINSVRGLVWNHDHLIVMAAPNVTVFYDRDGDGVAEESKVIIHNLGRTIADARVDHGQNSLEVGIDGWIYLAEGDQGFREATGTDGRKITLRGGGVIRFREDGTGLEIWAQGTRNIYGVAVSPTLEAFARDNTNDGGGWNVRFHHISGMEDHGYPSLFTNFPDEAIKPLADFGGGSGTGAMWLDEPGIPAHWNNAPYTSDYGRAGVFLQRVQPKGATFTITDAQGNVTPDGNESFISVTNPMDTDVDANSTIYVAKWSGGFSWAGRNQGVVYSVRPKNFTPAPLPNYDTIPAAQLVQELQSPSNRRRMEAQRAILRRSAQVGQQVTPLLTALEGDTSKPLSYRTAALFTDKQLRGAASTPSIVRLVSDPTISALAIRALGDDIKQAASIPIEVVTGALRSSDPRTRKEALITLARANSVASAPLMVPLLADSDDVIALTAVQTLRALRAVDASLAAVDSTTVSQQERKHALEVLQVIHEPRVTDALEQRVAREQDVSRRDDLVAAIARLAHTESEWNGTWWATRPDNTGPYFAPAPWSETNKLMASLNGVLDKAGPEEVLALGRQYLKQGVSAGPAVTKFLAYADSEPKLIPQITSYFATADDIPANALPVLSKVASAPETVAAVRAQAITALSKTSDPAAWATVLPAVRMLSAPAAAGGGGGGGRGAQAAPAAAPIPGATTLQTLLVTGMDAANAPLLQAVAADRTAIGSAPWAAGTDAAVLATRANAIGNAELALAMARADAFQKIQASIAKFTPQQKAALTAQELAAAPAAAPANGRGGGGRGGAAGPTPVQQAQQAVINTPRIDDVYPVLIEAASRMDGDSAQLADSALLTLAGRKFGATGPRDAAARALDAGWSDPRRRAQIIMGAVVARDTTRASQIVAALNDPDVAVARAAQYAVQQLNIDAAQLSAAAAQPKLGTMQTAAILDAVVGAKGSVARGQQLTRELGCVACHTFNAADAPKGPDLSKVSNIMQRRDIAEAILNPNKSIAQGFATNVISLKNGTTVTGFVVNEAGDSILVRDISAQQQRIATADIAKRTTMETSLMPPGLAAGLTLTEFASLLDYIESLGK